MKILHVIPAVAPRYGGPSRALAAMCAATTGLGIDTLIATTDADGPTRLDVPLESPTVWEGVPAIFFKRDFSEAYKYSHRLAAWLRTHVAEFDAVHVHAVLSHAPLSAAAACRSAHVPYVVRPLGTITPWSLRQKAWRKRGLLALGGSRMLREASAIHCTSDEERRGAEMLIGPCRSFVIPLGVETAGLSERAKAGSGPDARPYVLSLSRLHPKKNLETLISAFADVVRDRFPDWTLVIAGAGDADYGQALERLAAGVAPARIRFAGWVEGQEKQDLLRRAALFAMPSLDENFGVSLIEALAAGVPAVLSPGVHLASDVAAAGAGWIVGPDRTSIGQGLAEAMADAGERDRRGRAAAAFSQAFAWPRIASQLADMYQQVVSPAAMRQPGLEPHIAAVERAHR